MPLYLVRWPGLAASIVRARDRAELLYLLDHDADPTACEISHYHGPVFFDLSVPIRWHIANDNKPESPLTPDQIVVDDVSAYFETPLDVRLGGGEIAEEIGQSVRQAAFPNLYRVDPGGRGEASDADLKAAATRDLALELRASWQTAQVARRDDPVSRAAHFARTSPEVVRAMVPEAGGDQSAPAAPEDPISEGVARVLEQWRSVRKGQIVEPEGPSALARFAYATGLEDANHRGRPLRTPSGVEPVAFHLTLMECGPDADGCSECGGYETQRETALLCGCPCHWPRGVGEAAWEAGFELWQDLERGAAAFDARERGAPLDESALEQMSVEAESRGHRGSPVIDGGARERVILDRGITERIITDWAQAEGLDWRSLGVDIDVWASLVGRCYDELSRRQGPA